MAIIEPDNYSFSFGQLANVIPPSDAFTKMSAREQQAFGAAYSTLAEHHGLLAAFSRLMPEDKYAGTFSPDLRAMVLEKKIFDGSKAIFQLARFTFLAPERIDERPAFACVPLNVAKEAATSGYSAPHQFISGGQWLRDLEAAANKAPFNRHEAGAASFQRWLRLQQG